MKVGPRRIAAASRALQGALLDAIALRSTALSEELAQAQLVVPWDRQRLIGQVQQSLMGLRDERFVLAEGEGVRVIERADQPFESIEAAWRQLRQGRRVWVEKEAGACEGAVSLLRAMGQVLRFDVLRIAGDHGAHEASVAQWPLVGPPPAPRRVVAVAQDADPELAAYFVARACLRRTGFDPRCVHRVLVAGDQKRFERLLSRLFVGARMGHPHEGEAFAGPVTNERATAYDAELTALRDGAGIEELCSGGRLDSGGAPAGCEFLAPALFAADGEEVRGPGRDPRGPCLILQRVDADSLEASLRSNLEAGSPINAWVWVGEQAPRMQRRPLDRWIAGALAVSRLPPGLPLPRP